MLQRVTETQISANAPPIDGRLAALRDWLSGIDTVAGSEPVSASEDASFRRYFRLHRDGESFIVMDAPPEQEDSQPFIRVAGYLEAMQLNAPRVIEADLDIGFLLLTDLGSTHYLEQIKKDATSANDLYADAIEALLTLQDRGTAYQSSLPPYDDELLRFELSLFHDWLCQKHLGIEFSDSDEHEWQNLCDLLVANALDQPQVFVHRDYHSRNLMVTDRDNPGILDFQDAVEGPLSYDLVSLLKDCYVRWPRERVDEWLNAFYEGLGETIRCQLDASLFRRNFELMGVQRHLKASGIFARLNHRDGKPGFLPDVPRTLSYIVELGPQYEELEFLVGLISEQVLPGMEVSS